MRANVGRRLTRPRHAAQTFSKIGGPYQLPSGTVVANNWADFTSGSLRHANWCGYWTYGWVSLHSQVGSFSRADGGWASNCFSSCESSFPLYCVQQ